MPSRSERVFCRHALERLVYAASDVDDVAPAENSALNRYFSPLTPTGFRRDRLKRPASHRRQAARFMRFE